MLEQAGIRETKAVVITTHDDDTNIYLTLYYRRLRPDIQIISRCRLGGMSPPCIVGRLRKCPHSSIGATMMLNLLNRSNILMVAEGLDLIRIKVPHSLAGRTIAEADVRRKTGCTIVALQQRRHTYQP